MEVLRTVAVTANLFIYPVKSLGGISLTESPVEKRGLKLDRRGMIVDAEGVFMTQRSVTRLALFRTSLGSSGLRLTAHSGSCVDVPFAPQGEPCRVRVWKDECDAV